MKFKVMSLAALLALAALADQVAVAIDNARSFELSQQAVMEMREADRLKSQFLANMSHELRTPLNAIIGFTRIVRRKSEGVLAEKQTENLDKVLTSADHLLNLINTVLDIAKIEAGRMDVLAANFRIPAPSLTCASILPSLLSSPMWYWKNRWMKILISCTPIRIRFGRSFSIY